jgi:hypothetical protein
MAAWWLAGLIIGRSWVRAHPGIFTRAGQSTGIDRIEPAVARALTAPPPAAAGRAGTGVGVRTIAVAATRARRGFGAAVLGVRPRWRRPEVGRIRWEIRHGNLRVMRRGQCGKRIQQRPRTAACQRDRPYARLPGTVAEPPAPGEHVPGDWHHSGNFMRMVRDLILGGGGSASQERELWRVAWNATSPGEPGQYQVGDRLSGPCGCVDAGRACVPDDLGDLTVYQCAG